MFSLFRRYWNERISYEGGMSLLLMEGLLLVPLIMAAFFYPLEVAIGVGIVLLVVILGYEAFIVWRRRRGHSSRLGA